MNPELIIRAYSEYTGFSEANGVKPPAYMANAAKMGLKIREKQSPSNKAGTPVGLARARQLANRKTLSLSTLKRLKSFASRHGGQFKASYERDSKYWQALMLWGIPYSKDASKAKANIDKVINWADAQIRKLQG